MHTTSTRLSAAICLLGGALFLAPPAHATGLTCQDGTNPVPGSTVQGNLNVPAYASCSLLGVTVTGNVTAGHDSCLVLVDSTVNGNLTVQSPDVSVENSKINGSAAFSAASGGVVVDNTVGACGTTFGGPVTISNEYGEQAEAEVQQLPEGSSFVFGQAPDNPYCGGNVVKSNVTISNNDLPITFGQNRVTGNVQVQRNEDPICLIGNVIGNNLSCTGNSSLIGQGTNNVHGNESGQCKGF